MTHYLLPKQKKPTPFPLLLFFRAFSFPAFFRFPLTSEVLF